MERFNEIWSSIRTNKLRTFLTGFSVAWGIFMLVILLGVGNGLQNGTKEQFKGNAINSIRVSPGQTSLAYNGLQPGRKLQFHNDDLELIKREFSGIEHITARLERWNVKSVQYKAKVAAYKARGIHSEHRFVEKTVMILGRYINDWDVEKGRKVCVIGQPVQTDIFEGANPMGEWLNIGGVSFRVVGVCEDEGSEGESSSIYLPISTAQLAFGKSDVIDRVMFTTGDASLAETRALTKSLTERFASKHNFDPADTRALYIRNNFEEYSRISNILTLMQSFFWLIGILTIFAGIVGVSNIMLITVQERTKEIGIRKSIGAKPWSIILMVVQESIFITAFFGYIGLFFGILLLEIVSKKMPDTGAVFKNPSVDFNTAIIALMVLIIAGGFAAFVPARRAAQIRPVEALSAD
ncbi:MAG: putative ABC transport system permease protein [Bacteroidia bacterium]|jgi:putative ABC transport system permease protein